MTDTSRQGLLFEAFPERPQPDVIATSDTPVTNNGQLPSNTGWAPVQAGHPADSGSAANATRDALQSEAAAASTYDDHSDHGPDARHS